MVWCGILTPESCHLWERVERLQIHSWWYAVLQLVGPVMVSTLGQLDRPKGVDIGCRLTSRRFGDVKVDVGSMQWRQHVAVLLNDGADWEKSATAAQAKVMSDEYCSCTEYCLWQFCQNEYSWLQIYFLTVLHIPKSLSNIAFSWQQDIQQTMSIVSLPTILHDESLSFTREG